MHPQVKATTAALKFEMESLPFSAPAFDECWQYNGSKSSAES